ncbi:MAG TPA: M1 family aminopeptidase [Puia sp.]|nr:M1 family aminopeptidase [Puia sp.]
MIKRISLLLFCSGIRIVLGQTGPVAKGDQTAPGVPYVLARYRSTILADIHYELAFHLPAAKETPVQGEERLLFRLATGAGEPLMLDFKASPEALRWARINGKTVQPVITNEHLALPAELLHSGTDTVELGFIAGNPALNRNSDFLYTLLVPDRARTLFPCFDQPDLKAVFTLTLTAPAGWTVMGNAPLQDSTAMGDSCRYRFGPSDKIPTYLFSFVAGRWSSTTRTVDGRPMRLLYRETDSTRLRLSLDSIFRIEGQALHFMQEYTGIAYPFQKLDIVAVPDFQFGGMEHVGAILFKASSLFLDSGATREQFISRSNLLSHETAHMWFGDLVTMTWFNDVWMKEVFANFMADKISNITLPDGNYDLKFLVDHYPAAYSVDRTAGTHAIRQRLDNLQDAGSLYGNIIYNKAPIVMRQLELLVGATAFRSGLRDYLHAHLYGNAGWPDLMQALQKYTKADLAAWNAVWVDGTGRPSIACRSWRRSGDSRFRIDTRQRGEDGSKKTWPQTFAVGLVYPGWMETLTVKMYNRVAHSVAPGRKDGPEQVILNANGYGYGLFSVPDHFTKWMLDSGTVRLTPVTRASMYINLYENMLDGKANTPEQLLAFDRLALTREPEELDLNLLLDQVSSIFWRFLTPAERNAVAPGLEADLWQTMLRVPAGNEKKLLFRAYSNIVLSKEGEDRLFTIWKEQRPPAGVKLSEDDYTGLAASLALRVYPGYRDVLEEQGERIQNSDRKARWQYLQAALSADTAERDRFFASLRDPVARRKEAWVLTALSYLHHPLRVAYSEKYLPATLDWLEDIQRTGDVFFPQGWLGAGFGYYQTASAAKIVTDFLARHPDYNPKLKLKILQATDNLFRARRIMK